MVKMPLASERIHILSQAPSTFIHFRNSKSSRILTIMLAGLTTHCVHKYPFSKAVLSQICNLFICAFAWTKSLTKRHGHSRKQYPDWLIQAGLFSTLFWRAPIFQTFNGSILFWSRTSTSLPISFSQTQMACAVLLQRRAPCSVKLRTTSSLLFPASEPPQ